jgi:Tol biopolymer transport system component
MRDGSRLPRRSICPGFAPQRSPPGATLSPDPGFEEEPVRSPQRSIVTAVFLLLLAGAGFGQVTQRVSVSTRGIQPHGESGDWGLSISGDGRYVAFSSYASDLVPGDTNRNWDVFVRDRRTGVTERVNVSSTGEEANGLTYQVSISGDGRYVCFSSEASNLVPGDRNGTNDVFVHDRVLGTTELASVATNGEQGNYGSGAGVLSADGRYVLFASDATNLVPGGAPNSQVYVRDRLSGTTERVSVSSSGTPANDECYSGGISADGRFAVFGSYAGNLVPGDTNLEFDVFVHDRQTGTTERVNVSSRGAQTDSPWGDFESPGSISADGRYVAFDSHGDNLVPGDTNDAFDVFVHDRLTHTTERVSVNSRGAQGNDWSFAPSISGDGRYVMFTSFADNLVSGDTNLTGDIFVHDRVTGRTERVSLSSSGGQGNAISSRYAEIAKDGQSVVFQSAASNLVPADTNGFSDIFVRDRFGGPTFTSLCDPGSSGVIGCPCSNPPGSSGQGCDNSSATGGATLSATGGTYVSSDSLEFHVDGATPSGLGILLQGTTTIPTGAVYGQGVRCVGGTIKRLGTKHANGGSMTIPDFEAGDPQVTAASAAKGDLIQPGDSRYYLVYYRDPNVLGGCPASSTFSCTQTGSVQWSP